MVGDELSGEERKLEETSGIRDELVEFVIGVQNDLVGLLEEATPGQRSEEERRRP